MFYKIKKNYFLLISTFLILYFLFNLLGGERGLFSFVDKKKNLNDLQNHKLKLSKQIKNFEFRNSLLSDNLDLDYVEILIRQKFLFGKKNETLYIITNNDN